MFDIYTCLELKEMLTDALDSLHNLRTGKMARVIVDKNGERVEFTAATQSGLITYINQLRNAMVEKGCDSSKGSACAIAPIGFTF